MIARASWHLAAWYMAARDAFWFLASTAVLVLSVMLPLPGTDGRIEHIPSMCPFYVVTGLPCPGCGLTRSFVCIGHGEWRQSLHWHPLGLLLFGLTVLYWLREAVSLAAGRRVMEFSQRMTANFGWALLGLVIVVGVARIGWLCATHSTFGQS